DASIGGIASEPGEPSVPHAIRRTYENPFAFGAYRIGSRRARGRPFDQCDGAVARQDDLRDQGKVCNEVRDDLAEGRGWDWVGRRRNVPAKAREAGAGPATRRGRGDAGQARRRQTAGDGRASAGTLKPDGCPSRRV